MVTIPAFVWRGGFVYRALITGLSVGLCLGVLAWLDSGFFLAGALVFVIVGLFYGTWMPLRMARYWPMAKHIDGAQRVALVGAARRGDRIDDPRLVDAAVDYRRGMHAAVQAARPLRWLLLFVLGVAVATAVWDAVFGSIGNAVVSFIYLALLLLEVFWWPKRQTQLLANVDRACG
ncbi:hypothetical protein ACRCUN_09715 [Mycobacterium sp. LTG2003]